MKVKARIKQVITRAGLGRIAPIIVFLSIFISGSSIMPDQDNQENAVRNKKIDLLEKLESGRKISSDEIRSSFGDSFNYNFDFGDPSNCDRDDLRLMGEEIKKDLDELRHQMERLKNSEEFENAKDEFRKGMDQFRREMDKMRDELRKKFKGSEEKKNSTERII